jgi:hypothetical protein
MLRFLRLFLTLVFLGTPALWADGRLDGSAWSLRTSGVIGEQDRISFATGQFSSDDALKHGGAPVPYDTRVEGPALIWTVDEPYGGGRRIWQGVWDGSAKMSGTFSFPLPDGRIETREWQAERERP